MANRSLYRWGYLAYFGLLVYAILFYKERIIFSDAAFYTFEMLRKDGFAIMHYRFIAVCTELLPVLFFKFGCSLQSVACAFSVSFVLYAALIYYVCGSVLGNRKMALVWLLCQTIFVAHTFFWIASEFPTGLGIFMLVLAYTDGRKPADVKKGNWLLLFVAIICMAFAHTLLIVVFAFSYFFFLFQQDKYGEYKILFRLGLFYVLVFGLKLVFFREPYEHGSISGLKNFVKLFPDYFSIHAQTWFLSRCTGIYLWIPLILAAIIIYYTMVKQWLNALLVFVSVAGYIFVTNVCYPYADVPACYHENLYLPVGIMLALPLVYGLFSRISNKYLFSAVTLVLVSCVIRLWLVHPIYATRTNWERQFLQQHNTTKIIVDSRNTPRDTLIYTWGSAYEFWLLSTIETHQTASVVIEDSVRSLLWCTGDKSKFVHHWDCTEYKALPQRYFIFRDTTSSYSIQN